MQHRLISSWCPDKALDEPLHWRKARMVRVASSTSDLFHPDVPDEFILRVCDTIAEAQQHTFQILTKRPERMAAFVRKYLSDHSTPARGTEQVSNGVTGFDIAEPLTNVWFGVSVEDQKAADERIPLLLQTPAAVRFISAEPLLGPIDIPYLARCSGCGEWLSGSQIEHGNPQDGPCGPRHAQIDWVIVGGESGPGARPMHPDWARSLRDQCAAAGVPFLFKQHGEWVLVGRRGMWDRTGHFPHGDSPDFSFLRVGKRAAGRLLDGVLHDEYPEVHHA